MKTYLLLLSIMFGFGISVHAQQNDDIDFFKKEQWEQFKANEGEDWDIRWKESNTAPRTISNGLSKVYNGNAETIAKQFLMEYNQLFSMKSDLSDLRHVETKTNRDMRHVILLQQYKDIPVEGARYRVHIRGDNRIDMANGNYYPDINISTDPTITGQQAIQSAKNDLSVSTLKGENNSTELVVYPTTDSTFVLSYKTRIIAEEPSIFWLYFIDANTGEVIEKINKITPVIGTGNVYKKHPGISSVTTETFYRLDGNGYLEGRYVKVENDDTGRAYSASHNFEYSTSSTHFDEANLYYHVDRFRHEFIENIDDGGLGFTKITAHAHSYHPVYETNNAWFNWFTKEIYFGDGLGAGFNSFAREDKVIYHEYSHAVIYDINDEIEYRDDEDGAILEGTPDYFAGSFTNRPIIGEYAVPSAQRNMNNPEIVSYQDYKDQNIVGPHAGGEFFSSILWDIRNHNGIDSEKVDYLVYDALYRISDTPDFIEFRDALKAADYYSYGGVHRELIQNAFAAKGVGLYYRPTVTVNGPTTVDKGEVERWTANVSGGTPPYTYEWYKTPHMGSPILVSSSSSYAGTSDNSFSLTVYVNYEQSDTGVGGKNVIVLGDCGGGLGLCKEVVNAPDGLPEKFTFSNNYPNPFNPSTQIAYSLPENSTVKIRVYNIMGQQVATLVNSAMTAGHHRLNFDAGSLSSGVYIAKMEAVGVSGEQFTNEIKMQLIK